MQAACYERELRGDLEVLLEECLALLVRCLKVRRGDPRRPPSHPAHSMFVRIRHWIQTQLSRRRQCLAVAASAVMRTDAVVRKNLPGVSKAECGQNYSETVSNHLIGCLQAQSEACSKGLDLTGASAPVLLEYLLTHDVCCV